jgi:hypothetical protein
MKIAFLLFAAACGSSTTQTPKSDPAVGLSGQPAASSPTIGLDMCIAGFTRARTCTNEYIPALVDARARVDHPTGIADAVKADRNAVIAKAMEEWAHDSTDDAIRTNCQHIVATLSDTDRADGPTAQACMATPDCAAYTACIMPIFAKHL